MAEKARLKHGLCNRRSEAKVEEKTRLINGNDIQLSEARQNIDIEPWAANSGSTQCRLRPECANIYEVTLFLVSCVACVGR